MILLIFNWVSAIMLILILTIPFCRWENWGSEYFVFFSPVPNYGSEPGFSPHSLLPEPNYVPTMPLCFFILFLQSLPWFFVCHSDCTRMGLQVCSSPFNLVVEHFQHVCLFHLCWVMSSSVICLLSRSWPYSCSLVLLFIKSAGGGLCDLLRAMN